MSTGKPETADISQQGRQAPGDAEAAVGRPSELVRDELPGGDPGASQGRSGSLPERVAPTEEQVLEALRDVVDPELMVNVVDLGLVYNVLIDDEANVLLDMTLTSPACPLTDQLEWGAQAALDGLANTVTINWVWMPPWSLDMITDEGREQLRYIGFNV